MSYTQNGHLVSSPYGSRVQEHKHENKLGTVGGTVKSIGHDNG